MTSTVLTATNLTRGQQVTVSVPGNPAFPATGAVVRVTPHTNHLGGRWADVTVEVDGAHHTVDSRAAVITTPDVPTYGWCPTCRRSRLVVEESTESAYDLGREHHFDVSWYDCGHQDARETGTSAAPGAPWAPDAHPTRKHAQAAARRATAPLED